MQFCRRENTSLYLGREDVLYYHLSVEGALGGCVRMLRPHVNAPLGRETHMCTCANYTHMSQVCVFRRLLI